MTERHQVASFEECVHTVGVSQRRRSGTALEVITANRLERIELMIPGDLTIGQVQRDHMAVIFHGAFNRRDKDLVAPNHRAGLAFARQFGLPRHILRRGPRRGNRRRIYG